MDLVERYVKEVGRHLPKRQRRSVETELRSTLADALEDRLRSVIDPQERESEVVELLQDFGPPDRLAASYLPGRGQLVGPELYQGFLLTVKICWIALACLFLLRLALGLPGPGASMGDLLHAVVLALHHLVTSAMTSLGVVVVVFALVERSSDRKPGEYRRWDPRALPAVDDPDRVNRGGLIAGIAVVSALLLLFNFFPNWIGVFATVGEDPGFVPLLSAEFFRHLPLLNLVLLYSLALDFVLLRHGRWRRWTRVMDLGLSLLAVLLFFRLLANGAIVGIAPGSVSPEMAPVAEQALLPLLGVLLKLGFAAGLIGNGIGAILKVRRIFRDPSRPELEDGEPSIDAAEPEQEEPAAAEPGQTDQDGDRTGEEGKA